MNFESSFKKYLNQHFTKTGHSAQKSLRESLFYTSLSKAGRFRPRLCFAATKALGQEPAKILPWSIAIEMIHSASLIHDDLPAMDNARRRRGKRCNHFMFGEDMALLAGDCLFVESFALLEDPIFNGKRVEALRLLIAKAGFKGLMSGQALDLRLSWGKTCKAPAPSPGKSKVGHQKKMLNLSSLPQNQSTDKLNQTCLKIQDFHKGKRQKNTNKMSIKTDSQKSPANSLTRLSQNKTGKEFLKMIRLKTGALIEACVLGPALLWGKTKAEQKALQTYAENLGIAYQLADDLKDGDNSFFSSRQTALKALSYATQKSRKALKPLGPGAEELKKLSHFNYDQI